MPGIAKTEEFDKWLRRLKDTRAKAKVLVRIDRLSKGNPGDVGAVGEGISEMRIDYGPGYRVYYKKIGDDFTLLNAGTKASQAGDIAAAKKIAAALKE